MSKYGIITAYLVSVSFCILLTCPTVFADDSKRGYSLSELNYENESGIFLKEFPWPRKDPFIHPVFEVSKPVDLQDEAIETVEEPQPPLLDLTAILYSDDSSSAVISGRVVKVGSMVKNQKILEINKDSVKIDFNGKAYDIKLKDFTIKNDEN